MALETATYIDGLVSTNPASSDGLASADDHLRLLKSTIKATFPNVTGAVTPTHTVLNGLDARVTTVEGAYVKKDGTVAMTGALAMGTQKITGLATPTADTDASTKAYVDTTVTTAVATAAVRPCFQAHKNGTDQTGVASATSTKVTFTTEEFDVGGYYDAANSKFQPTVAGKYCVGATVSFTSIADGARVFASIAKNGSVVKVGPVQRVGSAGQAGVGVDCIVDFNGSTDYVEVYAQGDSGVSQTIQGSSSVTYFFASLV